MKLQLMSENIIRFQNDFVWTKLSVIVIFLFFLNKNLNNYTYDLNVDLNLEKIRNE